MGSEGAGTCASPLALRPRAMGVLFALIAVSHFPGGSVLETGEMVQAKREDRH